MDSDITNGEGVTGKVERIKYDIAVSNDLNCHIDVTFSATLPRSLSGVHGRDFSGKQQKDIMRN
jgi:hypothetical protein